MDTRRRTPAFYYLNALVFLVPILGLGTQASEVPPARVVVNAESATQPSRPAGIAAKEDCRLPAGLQCLWDQTNFQGDMKTADLFGNCVNLRIRSAANNGLSGLFTLKLYKEANCSGDASRELNVGESASSLKALSARFAPKDF